MKIALNMAGILFLATGISAAKWKANGDSWTTAMGEYTASVAPKNAGKIVGFTFRKADVIRPTANDGAFFWPAPQHSWLPTPNWPPPGSFADSAYKTTFNSDSSEIIMAGPPNSITKLQVTKRFKLDSIENALVLSYSTKNTATDSARHFAPWETSRGYSKSLLFFPKATRFKFANPNGSGLQPDLPLTKDDSLGWYQENGTVSGGKFFRDGGEGWMAQFKDSILFVKQYPDVDSTNFAPWESDIEGYASQQFIENEVLGPWTAVAPGDSLVWTTRWRCAIIPKSANTQAGSSDLKAAARALVKTAPVAVTQRLRVSSRNAVHPLVDARGRLLAPTDRALSDGALGVLPLR